MTMTDCITLVAEQKAVDSDGYETISSSETVVPCDSGSGVSRSEFYMAYKDGIKLDAVFKIWSCDYLGQSIVKHNSKTYKVRRSFPFPDGSVELNCSEVV